MPKGYVVRAAFMDGIQDKLLSLHPSVLSVNVSSSTLSSFEQVLANAVVVEGMGHVMMEQHWDECIAAIAETARRPRPVAAVENEGSALSDALLTDSNRV